MAQATKRYPFSLRKHGHDIEFRRNRAINEMSDKESNGTLTERERAQYEALIENLAIISLHFPDSNGVVWLTGKDYGLAKETVAWAEANRAVPYIR